MNNKETIMSQEEKTRLWLTILAERRGRRGKKFWLNQETIVWPMFPQNSDRQLISD